MHNHAPQEQALEAQIGFGFRVGGDWLKSPRQSNNAESNNKGNLPGT